MIHCSFKRSIGFVLLILLWTARPASGQEDSKTEGTDFQLVPVSSFNGEFSKAGLFLDAIALDLDQAGFVYIVDRAKHRLVQFTSDGRFMDEIGGFGNTPQKFDDPRDVSAFATLDVFVADYNNDRVVRLDQKLNYISSLRAEFSPPFVFEQIKSVAVSPQYDLFMLENVNNRILKFSRFSEPSEVFGGLDDIFGQLLNPHQLALDGNKRLFVSDPGQDAIVVFDYLGNFINMYRYPAMKEPTGIFWAEDRRLYVIDEDSNNLFIFSERMKFVTKIALDPFLKNAVDVAVSFRKDDKTYRVYILSPKACYIFSAQ